MGYELITKAAAFAKQRHGQQKRKYTDEPYINHPERVAALVAEAGGDYAMIAAAWLHDTVEDCGVTLTEIKAEFGPDVQALVFWLTDVSKPQDGNRAARKEKDRKHLSHAPERAQTIKLADLIDNSESITAYDKDFARVYLAEKERLLKVLSRGAACLRHRAYEVLRESQRELVQHDLEKKENGIR